MLDERSFWRVIADSRQLADRLPLPKGRDFSFVHDQALCELLRKLTPKQIIAFEERRRKLSAKAYRWDLWGAAYWYGGGCGDDAFDNFRWNLIALGPEWYDRLLALPDDLADLVGIPGVPFLLGAWPSDPVRTIYEEKTGDDVPDIGQWLPAEPAGVQFDFTDRELMTAKYPKLVAKLPDMGD